MSTENWDLPLALVRDRAQGALLLAGIKRTSSKRSWVCRCVLDGTDVRAASRSGPVVFCSRNPLVTPCQRVLCCVGGFPRAGRNGLKHRCPMCARRVRRMCRERRRTGLTRTRQGAHAATAVACGGRIRSVSPGRRTGGRTPFVRLPPDGVSSRLARGRFPLPRSSALADGRPSSLSLRWPARSPLTSRRCNPSLLGSGTAGTSS